MRILLHDATLLSCTGADPVYPAWLLIENELIAEIGFGNLLHPAPSADETINCNGQTLMPGLIEAHMHGSLYTNDMNELHRRYHPGLQAAYAYRIYADTLQMGFTSARDCGGVDPGFRDAINLGLMPGPRLMVAGPALTMTGGHADTRFGTEYIGPIANVIQTGYVADGVDEVRKASRELLRRGVDLLKVMAGGGCASASDEPDTTQYTPAELEAIVYEARAVHKTVAAHAYSNQSMRLCAEAGIYSIEHGNYLDADTAKVLKAAGCWLVPTLTTYEIMSTRGDEFGLAPHFLRKMREVREQSLQGLSVAYAAGLNIGSGSDVVGSGQPYKTMELELKAKVMGNHAAILSATRENARLMQQENRIGTVQVGLLADLLLISGDPLEDITLFQQPDKVSMIFQGGRRVR